MAIANQIVALNSSTATLVSIPSASEVPYEHNASISVQNLDSSATVFLGDSTVTSSFYGYALVPGASVSFDLLADDKLFAIASAGTPNVAVLAAEV